MGHAADHRDAARCGLDHASQSRAAGGLIERRAFAGGPEREEAVNASSEDVLDQPRERGLIDPSVALERRSESNQHAGDSVQGEHRRSD